MDDLRAMVALGERVAGTEGGKQAAREIERRLRAVGIPVVRDEFEEITPEGRRRFVNLVATIPGSDDRILLIGGHYDTKAGISPEFVGANDGGSSTAVLLELARVLAGRARSGPAKWIVFFDGEECLRSYGPHDGLHGSRHLARRLILSGQRARVKAAIIVDMVGDRDLKLTIPVNSDGNLVGLLEDCARKLGWETYVGRYPGEILDDHVPFLAAGIPAIDVIDFQYGSGPGRNDYWHTPADSLEHVSARSLEVVGRLVLCMVERLCAEQAEEPTAGRRGK